MSPLAQVTDLDHCGASAEDVTEDQEGSPERLELLVGWLREIRVCWYLMEVMSHPLATPALHIRDPRKPLPPATTTFFLTVEAILRGVLSGSS